MTTSSIPDTTFVTYLILGGGITGLSVAYHLEKYRLTPYLLVEKNDHLGGLCASETLQGFTFDHSGHLLHLRHPYTLKLVQRLLPKNLRIHQRQAFIDFEGKRIPYPFQANLWALPESTRQECLEGLQQVASHQSSKPVHFEQWCLQQFGIGIYRHFMQPYNQKLWQMPLTELTCDWCGNFIPQTTRNQIKQSAKHSVGEFGYNSQFYYPVQGGCGAVTQALAEHISSVRLQAPVEKINFRQKYAVVNGQKIFFRYVINTLPLPELISYCSHAPVTIRQQAALLRHNTVHVFQFAINREIEKPFHWIYFPQPDVPFFRVGMQSAFSPYNAPLGTSSFYVETTETITDFQQAEKVILKTLCQKGIIREQDQILVSFWRTIPVAYALYDEKRQAAVSRLLRWLYNYKCLCAGRYGRWEYSFMERSLLEGYSLAEQLASEELFT